MNQIEKLELELNTARRNLTAAQDEHKAVVQLWEVGVVSGRWVLLTLCIDQDKHKAIVQSGGGCY